MNKDLSKPIEERYIHGFATTIHGGHVLLTANPYLFMRIHHAKTLFVDTTFKRTVGALKEWEVVMYDKAVERGQVTEPFPDLVAYFKFLDSCHHCSCI